MPRLVASLTAALLVFAPVVAAAPANAAPAVHVAAAKKKHFSSRAKVTIVGTAIVGGTLVAKPVTWGVKRTTYRYRWYVGTSGVVSKAQSLVLGPDSAGQAVRVVMFGTKRGYVKTRRAANVVVAVPPKPPAPPPPTVQAPYVAAGPTNQPGAVYLNPKMLQATEHFYVDPTFYVRYSTRVFTTNGGTFYRSPATSGPQSLQVTYVLQTDLSGSWQVPDQLVLPSYSGQFAGDFLTTDRWSTEPVQATTRVNWRFVYAVTWFDANGTQIGYAEIYPSQPQDAVCETVERYCTPFIGGVYY